VISGLNSRSTAFHDADVPFGAVAKRLQDEPILGIIMAGSAFSRLSNGLSSGSLRIKRPRFPIPAGARWLVLFEQL
jgi:hypothetical protein